MDESIRWLPGAALAALLLLPAARVGAQGEPVDPGLPEAVYVPPPRPALADLTVDDRVDVVRSGSAWLVRPAIDNDGPASVGRFLVRAFLTPKLGAVVEVEREWAGLGPQGSETDEHRQHVNTQDVPHVCYHRIVIEADAPVASGGRIRELDETNNVASFELASYLDDLDDLFGEPPRLDPAELVLYRSALTNLRMHVKSFVLDNPGSEAIERLAPRLEGADRAHFRLGSPAGADVTAPATVAAGGSETFRVEYDPPLRTGRSGVHRARVVIDGSFCGPPLVVELIGVFT